QFFADVAVEHALHGLGIGHEEGQIEQIHAGLEIGQVARGRDRNMDEAHLRLLDDLYITAQLCRRTHVDLNTAVGIAFYLFLEFHGCVRVRRAFHQDVGECEVEISSVCGAAEHHGHDARHGDFLPVFAGHVYSFTNDGYWCR